MSHTDITLTKDDTPGASLSEAVFQKHTYVKERKRTYDSLED